MKLHVYAGILVMSSHSAFSHAEVSVTGTIISDYIFRGISQTDSSPALQASLDYAHDNGFYTGVWASNVDYNDNANAEVDVYFGYGNEISEQFSYDLSFIYYIYTGYGSSEDYNYGEVILNSYFNEFTITLGYSNNYDNSSDSSQYINGTYNWQLYQHYTLTLQVGYTSGGAFKANEYIDYSLTLSRSVKDFDISAALINTDINNDDTADFRFVLGVSRTF